MKPIAAPCPTPCGVTNTAPSSEVQSQPVWLRLASEDLATLAWLHAQELAPSVLQAIHAQGFPASLSLLPPGHPAVQALQAALDMVDSAAPECSADELAADYAAIYLNHGLRAAPYESVWRDEDHLLLQGPTFAVREFYRRNGVQVANWRERADDHLTHELNFVAHLLAQGEQKEAARFLAQHLMQWLPQFASRVAQRAATPLYAALAVLTQACCEACQQRLPTVAVLPPVVAARDTRATGCSG